MRRAGNLRSSTYRQATPRARAAALGARSVSSESLPGRVHGLVVAAALGCLLLVAGATAEATGAVGLAGALTLSLAVDLGAGLGWALLRTIDPARRSG